jgi:hypothetical protein
MEESQASVASFVITWATEELHAKSITLDELVREVLPLLSDCAPTTIEVQIPVFMEWEENDLKGNMALLKKHYTQRHLGY